MINNITFQIEESETALSKYTIMVDGQPVTEAPDHGTARRAVEAGINMVSAVRFADSKHGDQMHGTIPVRNHLASVAEKVMDCVKLDPSFSGSDEDVDRLVVMMQSAVLHDVLEDTDATVKDLYEHFGPEVALTVYTLTDSEGADRYERHLNTYWAIREAGADTVLIKLCDRWHNHKRSIEHGESYRRMYADEYPYFKMALWRPDEHVKIWQELDDQFRQMKDALDGERLREREQVAKPA